MSIVTKLAEEAANNFIEKVAFFASLPAPAQAALLQGGLGALLGGGLGGIKGLVSPDEEVDEDGNPTGKRKSRLSSALRSGGIGAAAGGALGAFRGAAKTYLDGKRNELTSRQRAAAMPPKPESTGDSNPPKSNDNDGKPLLFKNRGKAPVLPTRKPEAKEQKPDYEGLAIAKRKYMADPDMSDYIRHQEKLLEVQKSLVGYGYKDSEGKAKMIENALTSPTTLDMVYRQKLLDKAILNADRNAFIGRNYDPITKEPKDYITAYPKGKHEYLSEIGHVPYNKDRAQLGANTRYDWLAGSHALPPTPEMDKVLSVIEDRLRAPKDRKFEYGPTVSILK